MTATTRRANNSDEDAKYRARELYIQAPTPQFQRIGWSVGRSAEQVKFWAESEEWILARATRLSKERQKAMKDLRTAKRCGRNVYATAELLRKKIEEELRLPDRTLSTAEMRHIATALKQAAETMLLATDKMKPEDK